MAEEKIEIYDIMACNVFWNFPNTGLPQEQHKFLVAFHPTGGRPIPELIDSIRAKGPDGYEKEIANQTFKADNCNGHIFDRTTNSHWYMLNLPEGFMKEGEYTIEVTGKDGIVRTMSRVQKDAPGQALLKAYKQVEDQIHKSYRPADGSQLPDGTPLKDIEITWKPSASWQARTPTTSSGCRKVVMPKSSTPRTWPGGTISSCSALPPTPRQV